ncbi:MAG: hypothetical protein ACRDY2_03125 [Acidimicrobiales bacterium]
MRRFRISAVAGVFAVTAVASACGGGGGAGNGVASKSVSAILAASKAAGSNAGSVKVTASADKGGTRESYVLYEQDATHFDENLGVVNGQRFTRLSIGSMVYLIGNEAFLKAQGASPARQRQLNDKWVAGTNPLPSAPPKLTKLMNTLLVPSGVLTKGPTSTLDGQRVVAVVDAKAGGTLYVATTGKPYPVEVVRRTSSLNSTVKFSDWNQPVKLDPPTSYQPLSLLTGASG